MRIASRIVEQDYALERGKTKVKKMLNLLYRKELCVKAKRNSISVGARWTLIGTQ